ncbi:MAG: DNA-processing protein DprA [bacterium]
MPDIVIAFMNTNEQYDIPAAVLALTRYAEVNPRLMEALLRHFGRLEDILEADASSLTAIEGLSPDQAARIAGVTTQLEVADEYLEHLRDRDIRVVTRFGEDYPQRLNELNDPPPLLFCRGNLPRPEGKLLAIAGTIQPSNEGIELTTHLAREAAMAGVQVISTLRGGIDVAAHLGARSGDGSSYAILDSGFDDPAMAEHMPVAIDIVGHGGVLSEWAPDIESEGTAFVSSNRLVAGMAQATVITELDQNAARTRDLLECGRQIGSMLFFLVDPRWGSLADEPSLRQAIECGAVPMVGLDKIKDIFNVLV